VTGIRSNREGHPCPQAAQAPGVVKVRLSGAPADVEMLAQLLADYAGSGLDVIERSAPYPNRRDFGVRVYLTLQITEAQS